MTLLEDHSITLELSYFIKDRTFKAVLLLYNTQVQILALNKQYLHLILLHTPPSLHLFTSLHLFIVALSLQMKILNRFV